MAVTEFLNQCLDVILNDEEMSYPGKVQITHGFSFTVIIWNSTPA